MKQVRVTASVDQSQAPAFYTALSDSPAIEETRVLEWNSTDGAVDTVLFAIDGDAGPFVDAASEMAVIEMVGLSGMDHRWTYALVDTEPLSTPMFDEIHRARTRAGLVVRKPIVYRDGDMHFRVVGDADTIQTAMDRAPDAMNVRIDEIGAIRGRPDQPSVQLSERQREALAAAWALGYYDQPRTATQAEVAAELGCAAVTAGEHLRKAEAKLVGAAVEGVVTNGYRQ